MKKIYIEIRYFFRKLSAGIRNLYRWFPIIWNDRDWDSAFIFRTLKFKLQNTADELERASFFTGYEHEVARIRLCVKLIERVQEQYYDMEWLDYETSTFEFIPTGNLDENGDNYYQMKSEVIDDRLDAYFEKYPLTYKRVVAKLDDDSSRTRIALYMGHERHAKAKRLLFNVLNKHIENWWN